jgi:hypothetical protein
MLGRAVLRCVVLCAVSSAGTAGVGGEYPMASASAAVTCCAVLCCVLLCAVSSAGTALVLVASTLWPLPRQLSAARPMMNSGTGVESRSSWSSADRCAGEACRSWSTAVHTCVDREITARRGDHGQPRGTWCGQLTSFSCGAVDCRASSVGAERPLDA